MSQLFPEVEDTETLSGAIALFAAVGMLALNFSLQTREEHAL